MQSSLPSSLNSHAAVFLAKSRSRSFRARSVILEPGASSSNAFLLVKGSAQLVMECDGKTLILGLLKPGDFFGDLPFPPAADGHLVSVHARSECQVALMSANQFKMMVMAKPEMLLDVCGQLNERLNSASRKVGDFAFLDIPSRIVSVIQDLVHASFAVKTNEGTVVPVTRQDLGRLAGCSRETAGRVLKMLEDEGLVSCSGRNITVLDTKARAVAIS
ncbi:TPA: cyclic nucleotide-binding domain-containing protein [Pseudomonas aeruginosa]